MHHQLEVQEHNETIEDFSYAMVIFILLCTIMLCIILYNRRKQTTNEMNLLKLKLENARNRISPHFIYNILNTEIETDENKHDIARNSKLVNLSKLIRLNLDLASNLFVSIDDEIDFVKQYVELQRSLIEGELVFTLNISPKVDIVHHDTIDVHTNTRGKLIQTRTETDKRRKTTHRQHHAKQ